MTRAELDKLAPLPWRRYGCNVVAANDEIVCNAWMARGLETHLLEAIVEAVNAHFGERNDKPVQP